MPRSNAYNITISDPAGRVLERWTVIYDTDAPEMPHVCNLAHIRDRQKFTDAVVEEVQRGA